VQLAKHGQASSPNNPADGWHSMIDPFRDKPCLLLPIDIYLYHCASLVIRNVALPSAGKAQHRLCSCCSLISAWARAVAMALMATGCCAGRGSEVTQVAKLNPEAAPGPRRRRQCRDVPFLLLFIAFWAGMLYIAWASIITGEPARLVHGVDRWVAFCVP